MKKVLFLMAFSLACNFSILSAQNLAVNTASTPTENSVDALAWNKTVHDFGQIPQGIPVETEFVLTNQGNEVLLIKEVKTTCGCTVAGYSQDHQFQFSG